MATNEKSEIKGARVDGGGGQLSQAEERAAALAGEAVTSALDLVAAKAASSRETSGVSTNLVADLNNLDFARMIGGPLQAAIDAQVASAMATVSFINEVGFKPVDPNSSTSTRELVMVDFSHTRPNPDGSSTPLTINVRVPLLAIVTIPALRIEQVLIDFNVKLNSAENSSESTQTDVSASLDVKLRRINFKVSASYQRKTASNVEVKKEYALNVNVKAVQDDLPAGLEKVLNLLAA
jgi:hypothetical protein